MRAVLRGVRVLIVAAAAVWAFWLVCLATFIVVNPAVNSLMVVRAASGTHVVPQRYLTLKQIPSYLRRGVLYLEDHNFYTHHGLVWGAIQEAWEANQRLGYEAYGGSTITQQLARTLFLVPDKNWVRKGAEAVIAVTMELVLSKDRILELYLNNIEWGPGVFGVEAASRYHFGTGVRNLNEDQAARLLAIITSPVRYNVETYVRNRGMVARYQALLNRN